MPTQDSSRRRIAIVGTGVSGLATLYSLRDSGHDVYLFEKEARLGGHTNTLEWRCPNENNTVMVDTGFIVINAATYRAYLPFYSLILLSHSTLSFYSLIHPGVQLPESAGTEMILISSPSGK